MRAGTVCACLVAWLALAPRAWAGEEAVTLRVQQQGEVRFVSGGIGAEERDALHALAPQFNLRLSFAGSSGAMQGQVQVDIRDPAGHVALSVVSEGPCLLVRLPAGRYAVAAGLDGKIQTRSATLRGSGATVLHYTWPEPREDVAPDDTEKPSGAASAPSHPCF